MENKERKPLSYILGQIVAIVVGLCGLSIVVALTVKLIWWILGI